MTCRREATEVILRKGPHWLSPHLRSLSQGFHFAKSLHSAGWSQCQAKVFSSPPPQQASLSHCHQLFISTDTALSSRTVWSSSLCLPWLSHTATEALVRENKQLGQWRLSQRAP